MGSTNRYFWWVFDQQYTIIINYKFIDSECIVMIKDKLMANFLEQLERTKSKDVLRQWSLVVRMLGKHLHAGADLINKVMKVIDGHLCVIMMI